MFMRSLGLGGIAAAATVAAMSGPIECDSLPTEQHVEKAEAVMRAAKFAARDTDVRNTTVVKLFYHVVYANETSQGGYMTVSPEFREYGSTTSTGCPRD